MPPEIGPLEARQRSQQALRRLRWPVARRLGAQAWGDERSKLRGQGVEYADVREYQFAEDARLIDWNLTARSDRPFVRESHPERGIDVWMVMDASRSLDWGTATCLKRDAAYELFAAATMLLMRHGNRVGAVVFDRGLRRVFPPAAGRAGRLALLGRMEAETAAPGAPGQTDLAAALAGAARLIRRPSVVIVISDFLVESGWQWPLRSLGLRHEVLAALISDPTEADIPSIGVVTFEDPETGAQLQVDTSSARLRSRYREAAAAQRTQLRAELRAAGAELLEITTAQPLLPQLVGFLRRRQTQRGRLTGDARTGARAGSRGA